MRDHIRILGILNIVMGCLTALGAIIVLIVMGGASKLLSIAGVSDQDATTAAPIIGIVGVCIAIFLLLLAAPALIGGWGLLNLRPWSRILMIIISIFHLFHVPLGTALGVYGLWILFSDEGRHLLETGGAAVPVGPPSYPVGPPAAQAAYPAAPPPSSV